MSAVQIEQNPAPVAPESPRSVDRIGAVALSTIEPHNGLLHNARHNVEPIPLIVFEQVSTLVDAACLPATVPTP